MNNLTFLYIPTPIIINYYIIIVVFNFIEIYTSLNNFKCSYPFGLYTSSSKVTDLFDYRLIFYNI